jgi:hypothetical protein
MGSKEQQPSRYDGFGWGTDRSDTVEEDLARQNRLFLAVDRGRIRGMRRETLMSSEADEDTQAASTIAGKMKKALGFGR